MSDYETLELGRRGGALTIALNRPDTLNAFNLEMGLELQRALREARDDGDVRAVCLTGTGRGFSAGADLTGFQDPNYVREDGKPDLEKVLHERYHPIITEIRAMPKPVVAALNGPTVGVGVGIALSCDLVVAKESAYLLLAFVNIGLVPDGGSSVFVPARGGFGRAMEMALLGEKVPAPTAERWNLVNRVHADADFETEVEILMDRLASGPTRSYAGTKRQLNAWLLERMDDQLGVEASIQGEMAGTADVIEGIGAFLMKRTPSFTGS